MDGWRTQCERSSTRRPPHLAAPFHDRAALIESVCGWAYVEGMLILVIVLVVLWVILAIVGFAIKGLLWLGIIGIVLVLATLAIGFVRRSALSKKTAPKARNP
jgi:hypothetical protein